MEHPFCGVGVLFMSDGKWEREMDLPDWEISTDWRPILRNEGATLVSHGKGRAGSKGKAFYLLVFLHFNPHLWS